MCCLAQVASPTLCRAPSFWALCARVGRLATKAALCSPASRLQLARCTPASKANPSSLNRHRRSSSVMTRGAVPRRRASLTALHTSEGQPLNRAFPFLVGARARGCSLARRTPVQEPEL
jgi:hypothetical protein